MKTITTKIPDNENKSNYRLIHKNTLKAIEEYLEELLTDIRCNDAAVEHYYSEIHNELEALRRL